MNPVNWLDTSGLGYPSAIRLSNSLLKLAAKVAIDRRGVLHVQPLHGRSGTWARRDPAAYVDSGVRLAEQGYVNYDFSKG